MQSLALTPRVGQTGCGTVERLERVMWSKSVRKVQEYRRRVQKESISNEFMDLNKPKADPLLPVGVDVNGSDCHNNRIH